MLNKEKEAAYLMGQLRYYKKEIEKLENALAVEDMVVMTNNTKTLMQNPKVKILSDYTKNLLSIYDKIIKLLDSSDKVEKEQDELAQFIQKRNRKPTDQSM